MLTILSVETIEAPEDIEPLTEEQMLYRTWLEDTVEGRNFIIAELTAALRVYADTSNWSDEAEFEYPTGRFDSNGAEEYHDGHITLDTECVWRGEESNGYELAQATLKKLNLEEPE